MSIIIYGIIHYNILSYINNLTINHVNEDNIFFFTFMADEKDKYIFIP